MSFNKDVYFREYYLKGNNFSCDYSQFLKTAKKFNMSNCFKREI